MACLVWKPHGRDLGPGAGDLKEQLLIGGGCVGGVWGGDRVSREGLDMDDWNEAES